MAQLVPNEDLSNVESNTPIIQEVRLGSVYFPGIKMESRKRCRVAAPDGDYMELATVDGSLACLAPRTKEIRTELRSTPFFSAPGHGQAKQRQPRQSRSTEHRK